jgi:hypothetical protein
MKQLIIILIAAIVLSCNDHSSDQQPHIDSVIALSGGAIDCEDLLKQDTALINQLNDQMITMGHQVNELQRKNDTLQDQLFSSNYKVERVRYYLSIALKNKSQQKFLPGWIKRAIE